MKKFYVFICLAITIGANSQIINFPDQNFKNRLLAADVNNGIALDANGIQVRIDTNFNYEIEQTEAQAIGSLNLYASSITDLTGIMYFTNLRILDFRVNQVAALNISGLSNLENLVCYSNLLTSITFSGNTNLKTIDCNTNNLAALDLSSLSDLITIDMSMNQLVTLTVSGLPNLQSITCAGNELTALNLTALPGLTTLNCSNNELTSLNLSGLPVLEIVNCSENNLTELIVTGASNLEHLTCWSNNLSLLDLSTNVGLTELHCAYNQFAALDLNNLVNLITLDCSFNQLTSLDVSALHVLMNLSCNANLLTALDAAGLWQIDQLNCMDNNLIYLLIKNGNAPENYIFLAGNPNLEYICVDEADIADYQILLDYLGYTDCVLNSYCTFSPGGLFYAVQGTILGDIDNNGCGGSDLPAAYSNLNISNSGASFTVIAPSSGNYFIPLPAGSNTITPTFENPSYFSVSPASVTADFPTDVSPLLQNFCVTPNGIHPDVEIKILPLTQAAPGFDCSYKILYKNKGTTTASGQLVFNYNDSVLDLVSVNPASSAQTSNSLTWDYSDLAPFETREIIVMMNLNAPFDTPPAFAGMQLDFDATISLLATDEVPADNIFSLKQIVVNSLDPNDKTCLEGSTVSPAMVGQFVHYLIRFENSGTANAQNIVVKDMIDTSKFNLATLVPLHGSHSFETRITEGNKVEFIFENIMLPFDDANNDGYVAFKIKTKPTLVVGDTFTNSASIYFDYNFPIVTNTASTTITALANPDFAFSDYFTVYPNPAKNVLNIKANNSIQMKSVNIYNMLGQLVLVITDASAISEIDVSDLKSGNYFLKINSDMGSANARFIKE